MAQFYCPLVIHLVSAGVHLGEASHICGPRPPNPAHNRAPRLCRGNKTLLELTLGCGLVISLVRMNYKRLEDV